METKMKAKDFLAINEQLKYTNKDETPYLVSKEDELVVVGDANQTALKSDHYPIKFRMKKKIYRQCLKGRKKWGITISLPLYLKGLPLLRDQI